MRSLLSESGSSAIRGRRVIRIKRKVFIAVLLVLSVSLLASNTTAELTYPTDDGTFIIDAAGVLNDNEESDLEQRSQGLADYWGTELVIVIIESTAEYESGTDENTTLPYYAVKMFEKWDVGDQLWKDGILLVLATNQSGSWEWWYELGLFWDETGSFQNIGATSDSYFDSGDWAGGLGIVSEDLEYAADSYWVENDGYVYPPGEDGSSEGGADSILAAIFCLAIAVLGIIAVAVMFRGGTVSSGHGLYEGPGVYRPWYRRTYWKSGPDVEIHHHHHDGHQQHAGTSGSFQSRRSTRSSSGSAKSRSTSRGSGGGSTRRSGRSSGSGGRRGGGRRGSR